MLSITHDATNHRHAIDICLHSKSPNLHNGCIVSTQINMISSTRQWLRRNRTTFAVGGAVLGAGYLATQFVLGKLTETRQRMSDERIAKEKYVDTVA
jgi:hypothetical protein